MEDSQNKPASKLYCAPYFSYFFTIPGYKSEGKHNAARIAPRPAQTFAENPIETIKVGRHEYAYYFPAGTHIIYITKKQFDCLHLASCHPMKEVAEKLGLSLRTVEYYLNELKKKLKCKDRRELNLATKNVKAITKKFKKKHEWICSAKYGFITIEGDHES